jgi:hypothetical protein
MSILGFWDLPDVKPMNQPPKVNLFYLDFHYETLGEQRRKKIEKIINKI